MRRWWIVGVVGVLLLGVGWITGTGLLVLGPGVIVLLVAYQNGRRAQAFDRPDADPRAPTPPPISGAEGIDLGDELLDLLTSARQRAARQLEDHGRMDPYEATERRFGARTLVFVERIMPRRIVIPPSTSGRLVYLDAGG
jgi:hypothetical protein